MSLAALCKTPVSIWRRNSGVSAAGRTSGGWNNIQTLTYAGVSTGTYMITVGGQTTASLAWDDDASEVQAALVALSTVGTGNAAVVANANNSIFTVTFNMVVGSTVTMTVTNSTNGTITIAVTSLGATKVADTYLNVQLGGTQGSEKVGMPLGIEGEQSDFMCYCASNTGALQNDRISKSDGNKLDLPMMASGAAFIDVKAVWDMGAQERAYCIYGNTVR